MSDPAGEDEAVTSSRQSFGDVGDDLGVAVAVGDESPVHFGQSARRGRVEVVVAEVGVVDMQDTTGAGWGHQRVFQGHLVGEGVADGSELPGDEFAEPVAAGGRGGQPEPELRADPLDGVVVRGRREVMAFVDDDVSIAAGEFSDVIMSGQRGQHGDVHDAGEFAPAAADLAGLDAQQVADLGAPLLGQRLTVDQDQGGGATLGDDRAGHDRLARSGRRDEYAVVVTEHRANCHCLLGPEFGAESDVDCYTRVPDIE